MKTGCSEMLGLEGSSVFPDARDHQTGSGYLHLKSERRKIRKVIVERKRRERIDRCLDQLKQILINTASTLQLPSENGTNLEKADILELTVNHLQELRTRSHLQRTYGYLACAQEVDGFLQTTNFDRCVRRRMMQFLSKRQSASLLNETTGNAITTGSAIATGSMIATGSGIPTGSAIGSRSGQIYSPIRSVNSVASVADDYVHLSMCYGFESQPVGDPINSVVQSSVVDTTSPITRNDLVSDPGLPLLNDVTSGDCGIQKLNSSSHINNNNYLSTNENCGSSDAVWRPW